MSVSRLYVEGYRSIRDLWLPLGRVNVIVGPNGSGKSNLYRALYLLSAAANGEFARALAQEGGMPSALWAGNRAKHEKYRLTIGVKLDSLKYELSCGLPIPAMSMFDLDPDIKVENVWYLDGDTKVNMVQRDGRSVMARDLNGKRTTFPFAVPNSESVLSEVREPHLYPELSTLRSTLLSWRFYHQFRTDMHSPVRLPQVGFRTPVISNDGHDLAAALQTIREIGDGDKLDELIDAAFPGSQVIVNGADGQFSVAMQMPGFARAFSAQEMSDGTLQYLCLLAALLSPRPASLLALNEPENSVHPDLYNSLAQLIAEASKTSQLWITTHSRELADFILEHTGATPIQLKKIDGATTIEGRKIGGDDDD